MWWAEGFVEVNGRTPPGLLYVWREDGGWLVRAEIMGQPPIEFPVEADSVTEAMQAAARELRGIVPHALFMRSPN